MFSQNVWVKSFRRTRGLHVSKIVGERQVLHVSKVFAEHVCPMSQKVFAKHVCSMSVKRFSQIPGVESLRGV